MWLLPSRSRPQNVACLIEACLLTGMRTPVVLRIDEDDPSLPAYQALDLPDAWAMLAAKRQGLSELYNAIFRAFPDLPFYGFIADDVVPETWGWDLRLIEAAGHDGMAVPGGGETTGGSPHFVLGGDLVRDVGWLALPGLDRIFIDTVWQLLAKERGVYRFMPEIMLRHVHFSTGAPMDETYRKYHKPEDKARFDRWLQTRKDKSCH